MTPTPTPTLSFSLQATSRAPPPIPGKTILFVNARDEPHIYEWMAHHLLLGFHTVYIFDHKSKAPIRPIHRRVLVERIEREGAIKIPLMNRATWIAKQHRYDWMLYLDADEFLVLNNDARVTSFVRRFSQAHAVAINWLMFGSGYHKTDPPGLMMEAYMRTNRILDQHVKTFVRPQEVVRVINPHFYVMRDPRKCVSMDFHVMNPDPAQAAFHKTDKSYDQVMAYIAHYYYQSEETFARRKSRNTDDTGIPFAVSASASDFSNIHNQYNDYENPSVKDRYAANIRGFLKGLG